MLDSKLNKSKPVGPDTEKFIRLIRKNTEDEQIADILEHMTRDACNGNEELASIFRRMIKAEMKHPYRAGCKHCEAKQKSAKSIQA